MIFSKQKLIDRIAHLDRELGHWFFLKFFSRLQPRYDSEEWEVSSEEEITQFFPEISTQNNVTNQYHQTFFESYLLTLPSRSLIDAATGWVYYRKVIPVHYSFPYALHPWKSYLKPSLLWCQTKNLTRSPDQYFDEAVNLIWYGWENFYHFFTDIVPILIRIRESEMKELPVLVPREKFEKKFVQDFLRMAPDLAALNFQLIADKNIIAVQNKLILVKMSKFAYPVATYLKQHVFCKQFQALPSLNYSKVFLYRPIQAKRSLLNNQQILDILAKKGFWGIDTSNSDLKDQVAIFKSVEVCVAINGAGIANLIFCENPFTLIELNARKTYLPDHYRLLTQQAGGRYYRLLGSEPNENLQYAMDSEELLSFLNEIDL